MSFAVDESKIESLLSDSRSGAEAFTALDRERLSIEDFAAILLYDENDAVFSEKLARRAQSVTEARFGRVKGLYIPLYLSNSCHNECAYCGFSVSNRMKRKTLTPAETAKELDLIYRKGFRNVLLVSGELNDFKNIGYLEESVEIAKKIGFHSISVELGALDENSAHRLAKAGAQNFVLYQETYHRPTYRRVHIKGLKADYAFRLGGPERAISAGFRQVALGFLVGLANPLFEALALYGHLAWLKKRHWDIEFAVSFPRIREAVGMDDGFITISDRRYARMLMAFRLAFPEIAINLSTRETPAFRDGMANICATHLSVESKTSPGGYVSDNGDRLEQFAICDNRSLDEMIEQLARMGYDVHFKDWEMELNRI